METGLVPHKHCAANKIPHRQQQQRACREECVWSSSSLPLYRHHPGFHSMFSARCRHQAQPTGTHYGLSGRNHSDRNDSKHPADPEAWLADRGVSDPTPTRGGKEASSTAPVTAVQDRDVFPRRVCLTETRRLANPFPRKQGRSVIEKGGEKPCLSRQTPVWIQHILICPNHGVGYAKQTQ